MFVVHTYLLYSTSQKLERLPTHANQCDTCGFWSVCFVRCTSVQVCNHTDILKAIRFCIGNVHFHWTWWKWYEEHVSILYNDCQSTKQKINKRQADLGLWIWEIEHPHIDSETPKSNLRFLYQTAQKTWINKHATTSFRTSSLFLALHWICTWSRLKHPF